MREAGVAYRSAALGGLGVTQAAATAVALAEAARVVASARRRRCALGAGVSALLWVVLTVGLALARPVAFEEPAGPPP